jgi:hypothetical protein
MNTCFAGFQCCELTSGVKPTPASPIPPALESGVIVRNGTAVVMVLAPDVVACDIALSETTIISVTKNKNRINRIILLLKLRLQRYNNCFCSNSYNTLQNVTNTQKFYRIKNLT